MHGFLDELDQAFLTFPLGNMPLDFQIDTGFSGTLIVGEEFFDPHVVLQSARCKPSWLTNTSPATRVSWSS